MYRNVPKFSVSQLEMLVLEVSKLRRSPQEDLSSIVPDLLSAEPLPASGCFSNVLQLSSRYTEPFSIVHLSGTRGSKCPPAGPIWLEKHATPQGGRFSYAAETSNQRIGSILLLWRWFRNVQQAWCCPKTICSHWYCFRDPLSWAKTSG